MIPNWNLISINIQLAKQITKILFTNVDIHSTNHLYLINFTYLATLRTHLEERIAHHEDRLKSKKKKNERWGWGKFSAATKVHIFEWLRTGRFKRDGCSHGKERSGVRGRAKKKRRRESKQERGKKRKQVGR